MTTPKAMTATSTSIPVILYGVSNNKPLAGLFPPSVCDHAIKAAAQLKLNVVKVTTQAIADVAKRLPAGRINAAGKGLVPSVRQPVYDQILKAVQAPATGSANEQPSSQGLMVDPTKIPLNEAHKGGNPVGSDGLPKDWKSIDKGHLVIVQESAAAGWAEAIVLERRDDMLTVKWKNYNFKPFMVHADGVALLNANPSFKTT